jgi:hypothetical protein
MGTVTDLFTRERTPDPPQVHETDESALSDLAAALDAEECLTASVEAVAALERRLTSVLQHRGPSIAPDSQRALASYLVTEVMMAEWAPMVEADA